MKKGDTMVDCGNGVEKMQRDVISALDGINCISANGTWVPLTQLLDCEWGESSVKSTALIDTTSLRFQRE